MSTAAANLQNLLRSLPPNAPPAVARNIETAVRLSGRFSEKASTIRKDPTLSTQGQIECIRRELAGGFGDHLAQLRREVDNARAGIAGEIGGLRKRAIELLGDGYSSAHRREIRDRLFQTKDPAARRSFVLETEDRLLQAAILELPYYASGLDTQIYDVIEQKVVEGAFGKRLSELEVENQAWEHADAVCKIVANELSKEAEINAAEFEELAA